MSKKSSCLFLIALCGLAVAAVYYFSTPGSSGILGGIRSKLPSLPRGVAKQTPLTYREYLDLGFPDPRGRAWDSKSLSRFCSESRQLLSTRASAIPGADGEFGKLCFQRIVSLTDLIPRQDEEEGIKILNELMELHDVYREAFNKYAQPVDREVALIRGLLIRAYGETSRWEDFTIYSKEDAMLPLYSELMGAMTREQQEKLIARAEKKSRELVRTDIRSFIQEMGKAGLFRPQARRIQLRYLKDQYSNLRFVYGDEFKRQLEKNLSREKDPGVQALYRELLATHR